MDINRFKQLLESTMGDIKTLIIEQPTKIKTGESLNDDELYLRACTTWNRWKSISEPEEIKKAKNWTKTITNNNYPYDMDVACASNSSKKAIGNESDRKVLKGVIELDWI